LALAPPGLLLFVLPVMNFMLQKFTKKTTFYYKQFNDLGNLYDKKGQNRPRKIHQVEPYLHQNERSRKAEPAFFTSIKKPAEAGFFL
jgi:hypothetical protein